MGHPLALGGRPARKPVRRDRGADVDQHRVAVGRDADRDGVGRVDGLASAERRHRGDRRIGGGDDQHQPFGRGTRQEGGKAADMVAPADRHGTQAQPARPCHRLVHGLGREPEARQVAAVPGEGRWMVGHHGGLARDRHPALGGILEVGGSQLQAVRRVAHQVRLDEQLARDRGLLRVEPHRLEQAGREGHEIARSVVLGHGSSLPRRRGHAPRFWAHSRFGSRAWAGGGHALGGSPGPC